MIDPQQPVWERLLTLLEEGQSSFQHFADLLIHEEHTLRIMDRQGLSEVNSQKEHALDAMCRLEQQVEQELQQLSGSRTSESVGSWLKQSRDPRAQSAYRRLTELRCLARTIQEQGKTNAALIHRIQHRVGEAIHFLYTGLGTGPVYQGSGALNFPSIPGLVHLQG
jgi:flagellar biosynthesis/type III secretory pathway chaperone